VEPLRDTRRNTEETNRGLSAGITSESFPHSTNQPEKKTSDRLLVKYSLLATCGPANDT
jgi:hypothetical protein